jgi:hypothetical protein
MSMDFGLRDLTVGEGPFLFFKIFLVLAFQRIGWKEP